MKKLLVVVFVLFGTSALAEEQNWFQKEWTEIKEYQQSNWQKGKEQLANNKIQIQNLFNKVKSYVSQN
jgi:Sec-independent protein translocase protein TatA